MRDLSRIPLYRIGRLSTFVRLGPTGRPGVIDGDVQLYRLAVPAGTDRTGAGSDPVRGTGVRHRHVQRAGRGQPGKNR